MWWRAIIAGLVVAGVSEIADRFPRLGALLLTLPIVSIVAFIAVWNKEQNLNTVSRLAWETLVLVPLEESQTEGGCAYLRARKQTSRNCVGRTFHAPG